MADKYIISKEKLKAIADAVRAKTGETGTLTADQMASKIAAIQAGGNGDALAKYMLEDGPGFIDMIINYDAVTSYREYCFYEMKSINSISDNNVKVINNSAFCGCVHLSSVNFPNVTSLGIRALYNTYIQKLYLPNCVEVKSGAVSSKAQLTDVKIGTSVENKSVYLYSEALQCSNDAVVVLGGEKCEYTVLNTRFIDKAKEVIVYKPYSFYGNDNVEAFIFPQTLSYAPSADTMSSKSWYYVPADMLAAFKMATNWATVASRIRPLDDLIFNRLTITGIPNVYTGHAKFTLHYNDDCYIRGNDYKGATYTISSNVSMESSGPDGITVSLDNVKAGDTITITATSTKDPSISTTATFTAIYKEASINITTTQWDDTGNKIAGALTNVYQSNDGSYHISSGKSLAKVTFNGYSSVTVAIRSYAESSYDYTMLSALDYSGTFGRDSANVADTKGKQSSDTYIDHTYTADGGEHYFYVLYSKDGSDDKNDDRGYFYIKEAKA